jgi:cell division inhibitor SulA
MPHTALDKLLQRPDIWQGRPSGSAQRQRQDTGVSTGFSRLDECLHIGGWPRASLIEILCQHQGIGELQLLLPTLVRLTAAGRHCVLLSPPYIPYPPGLEAAGVCTSKLLVVDSCNILEQLWCAEQALRSGAADCLLGWFGTQTLQTAHLRKLLLAAKQSDTLLFLHRHVSMARQASPASLRLQLDTLQAGQLELQILKQPGGWSGQTISLPRPEPWLKTSRWHLPLTRQPKNQHPLTPASPGLHATSPAPDNRAAIRPL